jgi:hypothetical protein
MTRTAAALFLTAGLTACIVPRSLQAEHVLTGQPGAVYVGTVAIYMEGQPPPAALDEVGIVSATGMKDKATLQDVLGALQAEAANVGANAVVRVRYDRGASQATATGVAVRVR